MDETFEKVAAWCKPTMEHPLAIVLGSGLGSLGERVRVVRHIPYGDIDGFPTEAIPVEGHSFTVLVGELDGVPVVVYPACTCTRVTTPCRSVRSSAMLINLDAAASC